jgi:hypothetical protein
MVAVKGDGVKGGAVKGGSEGWRSEGCDTRQPTQTDRPFIHYWAMVWSSSPMSLAGGAYGHYITSLFSTTDNYYTATDIEVQGTVRVEE